MSIVARLEENVAAPVAYGAARKSDDSRSSSRRSLRLNVVGEIRRGDQLTVSIQDISPSGMLLEAAPGQLCEGDAIDLVLPETGAVQAQVVWVSGAFYGCQFAQPIPTAAVSAALLKSEPLTSVGPEGALNERQNALPVAFEPEVNFSAAVALSLVGWALIGAAIFLITLF